MIAADTPAGRRVDAVSGVAGWLGLAAAPTFAGMALFIYLSGGEGVMTCSAPAMSPSGGMVPMYVLMSIFHATHWLRLLACRRRRGEQARL